MPGMANIARDVPDYFDLTQNLGGTRARIGCVRIPMHDLQPEGPVGREIQISFATDFS